MDCTGTPDGGARSRARDRGLSAGRDPATEGSGAAPFHRIAVERQNKFADAEQEYKQALALEPGSSDALVGLANVYLRGQRFPEAEEYLRKVVAQRPNDPVAHIQLGRVLAADQNYDEAAAELQAGLKLAPNDPTAQRDLADIYAAAGKHSEAEPLYRALLVNNANDADLHYGLGQSLLKQKKFGESQQEFLAAVKLKPDWGMAYGELAVAANENQNYALAIKLWTCAPSSCRRFPSDTSCAPRPRSPARIS